MEQKEDYRLAAVMFTDIYGFSRMMEADEKGTLNLLQDHNQLIIDRVRKFNGNIIKTIGDAFLVDFRNTSDAVKSALEIQNAVFKYNTANNTRLMLRIGIHLGDIWFFENDALGEVINIASRLETLARPGRICISHDVYNQILNKVDVEIISLGAAKLKNISKEIIAYEILTDFASLESEEDIPSRQLDPLPATNETAVQDSPHQQEISDADLERLVLERLKSADSRVSIKHIQDDFSVTPERLVNVMDNLSERGILTRLEKPDKPEYRLAAIRKLFPGRKKTTIRDKIEKKIEKARKNINAFTAHIASFGAVNAFLFAINMLTSSHTWWFLYPLGGWTIGLATHYSGVITSKKHIKQLTRIPDTVTKHQFKLINKLQKTEEGLAAHIASYISVNGFLLMVNLITSSGHLWFIYPLLGWGVGFTIHSATSISGRKQTLADLENSGYDTALLGYKGTSLPDPVDRTIPPSAPASDKHAGEYQNILDQSRKLKTAVIKQVKNSNKIQKQKAGEIEELLNDFNTNMHLLIQQDEKISQTIATASQPEAESELARLQKKLEETGSDSLRAEYKNSIAQLENYRQSFEELADQKELIFLRISGALMSLKQLQLDLQKMEEISLTSRDSPESFEEKLADLSDYVRILQESYQDFSP